MEVEEAIQVLKRGVVQKRRRPVHITFLNLHSRPLPAGPSTALDGGGMLAGEGLNDGFEVGDVGVNMVVLN